MKLLFHRTEHGVFKTIVLPDKSGEKFQILKTQQLTNLDYVPTVSTKGQNLINKTKVELINYLGTPDKIIMLWLYTSMNILVKG